MSTQKQERLLSQKPEIIVATPGRFWELLEEVKLLLMILIIWNISRDF